MNAKIFILFTLIALGTAGFIWLGLTNEKNNAIKTARACLTGCLEGDDCLLKPAGDALSKEELAAELVEVVWTAEEYEAERMRCENLPKAPQ